MKNMIEKKFPNKISQKEKMQKNAKKNAKNKFADVSVPKGEIRHSVL